MEGEQPQSDAAEQERIAERRARREAEQSEKAALLERINKLESAETKREQARLAAEEAKALEAQKADEERARKEKEDAERAKAKEGDRADKPRIVSPRVHGEGTGRGLPERAAKSDTQRRYGFSRGRTQTKSADQSRA